MDAKEETGVLCTAFASRLDAASLADALGYLDFNEWGLALEVLAEKLCDEQVALTSAECDRFDEIASHLGIPEERFRFLREARAVDDTGTAT